MRGVEFYSGPQFSRRDLLRAAAAGTAAAAFSQMEVLTARAPEAREVVPRIHTGILQLDFFAADAFLEKRFSNLHQSDWRIAVGAGVLSTNLTEEEMHKKMLEYVYSINPEYGLTWAAAKNYRDHGQTVADSIWIAARNEEYWALFDQEDMFGCLDIRVEPCETGHRLVAKLSVDKLNKLIWVHPKTQIINLSFQMGEVEMNVIRADDGSLTLKAREAYTSDKIKESMADMRRLCEANPHILFVTAAGNDRSENGSDLRGIDDIANCMFMGEEVDGLPIVNGATAYYPNLKVRDLAGSSQSVGFTSAALALMRRDKDQPENLKRRFLRTVCDERPYEVPNDELIPGRFVNLISLHASVQQHERYLKRHAA